MEIRTIIALGVGIVGGAAGAWTLARRKEPGLIFEIEERFYVQAAVVEAIAARAARVRETKNTVDLYLVRRGVLRFRLAEFSADVPRYGTLYLVSLEADGVPPPNVRDVLIELASYGLARAGVSFTSRAAFERGQGRPLEFKVAPREVEIEREARRPSGSYFRVGDAYYADERFMERLEWIPGSDLDPAGRDVVVPIWKRGKLKFQAVGKAQMFPEQRGGLYLLKPNLEGVALEDYLTELVELGLVGWGGEWAGFPTHRSSHPSTGTPEWLPAGRIERRGEDEHLDAATVAQMLTRLASQKFPDNSIRFHWRDHQIAIRPVREAQRTMWAVRAEDAGVKALMDELILRRVALRPEAGSREVTSREPSIAHQSTGHVYDAPSGLTYIDGLFVSYLLGSADGASYATGRMELRFGPVESLVLTSVVHRTGPQMYYLFPDQAGELYEVDTRRMPALWRSILDGGIREGVVRRMPFPSEPPTSRRMGHIYRTADSKEYIDGAFLIQLRRNAAGWSVNNDGSLMVDLGRAADDEPGHVHLKLLAHRMGPTPVGLPGQAGDAYEVAGPKIPKVWHELVDRMLRARDVVLIEPVELEREEKK
jgi:hypothetical protein